MSWKPILPTKEQLAWLDAEVGVIIHLDMQVFESTYYFRGKWGYTPDAKLFNPKELNTDQWLETAAAAGAKYALFTAKHNSGFCFWPTKAHPYSVASSPWRGGKGDLVAEFIASCKKYGLLPGIYCSASANAYYQAEDPGIVRSGKPEDQKRYNDLIIKQYSEIWGNYGPLTELWFDGGFVPPWLGGPPIMELRERLQPKALAWCGKCGTGAGNRIRPSDSEDGIVALPAWGTIDSPTCSPEGDPDGDEYAPAEGVIANRQGFAGGWFWHEADDRTVRSPMRLLQGYYDCVGRNSNYLIGMVVDNRGLVPDVDVKAFREFGGLVRAVNSLPRDTVSGGGRILELPITEDKKVSEILLKENIADGERVRKYQVEARVDGEWRAVLEGKCIGHKRLLPITPIKAERLRLRILECVAEPEDCEFSAYLNPVRSTPRISRDRHGVITITQDAPGELRYTLDGSEPTKSSKLYTIPFTVKGSGVARVRLFQDQPLQGELAWLDKYREATFPFGLSDDDWEVVRADSEYAWPPGGIRKSDSKDNILHAGDWLWRSGNGVPPPHELVVDMKKSYAVDGFIIRTDNVKDYEFYVGDSPDKIDRLVAKGALEGACMDKQIVRFTSKSRVRYCRLVMLSNVYGKDWVVVRSLEITGG